MTEQQEAAMKLALEGIKQFVLKELTVGQRYTNEGQGLLDSIDALTAALEQPAPVPEAHKQEPMALQHWCTYCQGNNPLLCQFNNVKQWPKTYATNNTRPAERKFEDKPLTQAREPLTDEEIEQCMKQAYATVQGRNLEHAFARAIEAAHGITSGVDTLGEKK